MPVDPQPDRALRNIATVVISALPVRTDRCAKAARHDRIRFCASRAVGLQGELEFERGRSSRRGDSTALQRNALTHPDASPQPTADIFQAPAAAFLPSAPFR